MIKPFVLLCVLVLLSPGPALSAQELTAKSPAALFAGLEQLPNKAIIDSLVTVSRDYITGHEDSLYYHLLSSKAIERGEATGETVWKAAGLVIKTYLQLRDGDYPGSILTAEAVLPLLEESGFTKRYLEVISIQVISLLSSGDHAEAVVVYQKGIDYIDQSGMAKATARTERHRVAFQQMRELLTLQDAIKEGLAPTNLMVSYLTFSVEKEKEILELQQAQAELQVEQRTLLWAALTGLILLGGITLVLYRSYRNKQKANELLSRQRQELVVENNKLSHFAGIVSHDLLSNLNLILSSGNLLVGSNGGKEQLRSYYETTQATCRELKRYCENLLKNARVTDAPGIMPGAKVSRLLEKILYHYEGEFEKLNFRILRKPLGPLPLPEAVVEQLFHNVFTNALKYVPIEGQQPHLNIGCATNIRSDEQTIWVIEDNGPGMPDASIIAIMTGQPQRSQQDSQGVGLSMLVQELKTYGVALRMENLTEGGLRIVIKKEATA